MHTNRKKSKHMIQIRWLSHLWGPKRSQHDILLRDPDPPSTVGPSEMCLILKISHPSILLAACAEYQGASLLQLFSFSSGHFLKHRGCLLRSALAWLLGNDDAGACGPHADAPDACTRVCFGKPREQMNFIYMHTRACVKPLAEKEEHLRDTEEGVVPRDCFLFHSFARAPTHAVRRAPHTLCCSALLCMHNTSIHHPVVLLAEIVMRIILG